MIIDDHTRLAYAETLADPHRARDDRGLPAPGYRLVRRPRRHHPGGDVATTARAYVSAPVRAKRCASSASRHLRIRPRRPHTNGKAERLIQTLLNEWAYARIYGSSTERTAALPLYLKRYNYRRPHGTGGAEERGFSMALDSGLTEHRDTLVVLAYDKNGCLRGLLHLVPTAADRRGLSLSMMRRDPEAPNGLTEFMIVKAIEHFREQGIEEISLNFAAFARLLHSPRGVAERFLRRLLQLADSFFQIERLYRFNDKFNPRWEARYLMYEGTLNLPRAALATLWVEGQLPRPRLPGRSRASRA